LLLVGAFVFKQPFFTPKATGITGQRSVAADDPMAGYDNPKWVLAISGRCGPDGFHVAQPSGQFEVGDGLSIGNMEQFQPDAFLEVRPFDV